MCLQQIRHTGEKITEFTNLSEGIVHTEPCVKALSTKMELCASDPSEMEPGGPNGKDPTHNKSNHMKLSVLTAVLQVAVLTSNFAIMIVSLKISA